MALGPRPNRKQTPFDRCKENLNQVFLASKELAVECRKQTDSESAQEKVRELDAVLRLYADLQRQLGATRRECANYVVGLRKQSPKGDRSRNPLIVEHEGKTYLLRDGKLVPITIDDSPAGDQSPPDTGS